MPDLAPATLDQSGDYQSQGMNAPSGADMPKKETPDSETAAVKKLCSRIKAAKKKWEASFKAMKKAREFDYGIQRNGQTDLDDDRYINNMVNGVVNQKVATLYARNPKAVFQRRPRMDFELWDGDMITLAQALNQVGQFAMAHKQGAGGMLAPPLEAMAILQDFNNGRARQQMVKKVGDTLATVYQWQIDQQEPEFKKRMKSLVRRVCVCGVGYVKLEYVETPTTTPELPPTVTDFAFRAKCVKKYLEEMEDGDFDESSPKVEEIKATIAGLVYDLQDGRIQNDVSQHIIISFPKASAIIPDKNCTDLKDFVGCEMVAEERILPLDFVNEYYEVDIKASDEHVVWYGLDSSSEDNAAKDAKDNFEALGSEKEKKLVCVWEVVNKRTKTRCTVCNGWKGYLTRPEPLAPCTHRFWPWFALTFNDVEYENGDKSSPFPPSDVQLMKSAQKEYNRSREAWRQHRKANAPRTAARAGVLDPKNKELLRDSDPHDVIDVKIADQQHIQDVLMPIPTTPVIPQMYETAQLERDMELGVGFQQANIGPAQPNVTATVGSIAEQSRMTKSSSNVDDLDDLLSDLAKAAGEILGQRFTIENARKVAGPGSLVPDPNDRESFLNEIYLEVQAASSGRPNKGVEMANLREIMPLLLQAGANPQFLVEEMLTRWDDRLDITRAFPLVPSVPMLGPGGSNQGTPSGPQPVQNQGQQQRPVPPRPNRPMVDNQQRQ